MSFNLVILVIEVLTSFYRFENLGITLGPGLSNIPSTTALHAYKLSKVRPETIKEEKLESKRSLENMRKTFETMQLKLNRLIKVILSAQPFIVKSRGQSASR